LRKADHQFSLAADYSLLCRQTKGRLIHTTISPPGSCMAAIFCQDNSLCPAVSARQWAGFQQFDAAITPIHKTTIT
jgi:hypothetical protein